IISRYDKKVNQHMKGILCRPAICCLDKWKEEKKREAATMGGERRGIMDCVVGSSPCSICSTTLASTTIDSTR
ncbi:unnamed protein product, partial [Amoebophrya sp. A120]